MRNVQKSSCRRAAVLALCLAGVVASATAARAQARIEDCEKIQAADAYNQCLAKFGPTSKVKSVEPVKPGDVKDSSAEAAAGAHARISRGVRHVSRGRSRGHARGHGHAVSHRHSGRASGHRKRATFEIKQE